MQRCQLSFLMRHSRLTVMHCHCSHWALCVCWSKPAGTRRITTTLLILWQYISLMKTMPLCVHIILTYQKIIHSVRCLETSPKASLRNLSSSTSQVKGFILKHCERALEKRFYLLLNLLWQNTSKYSSFIWSYLAQSEACCKCYIHHFGH